MPSRELTPDLRLPAGPIFNKVSVVYRLTDSGWAVINRARLWTMMGLVISLLSLILAVLVASASRL